MVYKEAHLVQCRRYDDAYPQHEEAQKRSYCHIAFLSYLLREIAWSYPIHHFEREYCQYDAY